MTSNEKSGEVLLQVGPDVSFEGYPDKPPKIPRNKLIRRVAEPHLERRMVNGRQFYVYRRGIDRPVYLGTADYLLGLVIGDKGKHRSGV